MGILLAITGITLFSSKAVMVKMAYLYEVDTVSLLLLRMGFALPFYVAIALTKKPEKPAERKDVLWIIFLGLIGYYLASLLDFLGLQYVKAGLERLILFIYPTLVLFISFIFFRKKISRMQGLGVLVTYLGVVVIFSNELKINSDQYLVLGAVLIFFSALTYAGYLVGSGWIIPKLGAKQFTSYAMIVSCVAVLIHYSLVGGWRILDLHTEVYVIGFLMAIFATVIPSYLISYSIKLLGANNFAVFGSLGPISTILLAYFFLGETLSVVQIFGGVVIIGGIFLAEKKR